MSNPDMNLENLLYTEEQWTTLHPLINDAGDVVLPTPRLPQRPAELAANASNTMVTIHGSKTRIADTALVFSQALKAAILKISGPDISSETENFDTGHEHVPIWKLYHHVITNYGTKSPEDIAFFRQELRNYDMNKPFQQMQLIIAASFKNWLTSICSIPKLIKWPPSLKPPNMSHLLVT
jgi:hypothetical protein